MRLKRTHYCGSIRREHCGEIVTICGWVDRWRDHGGVIFIDLRDREGLVQIVFNPKISRLADSLRQEYVISIRGVVRLRPDGMVNKNLDTGEIEVDVQEMELLNTSETLPLMLHEDSPSQHEADESLRLTYRYLDLRRPKLQKNLKIRHEFLKAVRDFYASNGFWEIETPILYKSTPEGARDYLVPSRVHAGKFYALPQSPQTLKQLCMIGGLDRYFQIARCFRDEDLRADRQPEFTQIDVEMSFIDESDVMSIHEGLMLAILKKVLNVDISIPFKQMTYADAMKKYGSDKPDLRNRLELIDLTELARRSTFKVYQDAVDGGGIIKALVFEEKEALSRSELDSLGAKVQSFGAKGISWIRIKSPGDWQSPQAKFFGEDLKKEIEATLPFKGPQMLFVMCGNDKIVHHSLSSLRLEYGERFHYTSKGGFEFLWVTQFPLYEFNEEESRFYAAHHPFTSPSLDDLDSFMTTRDPDVLKKIRARAYDLVLNGTEIGGGSLRIYEEKVQSRMFQILGISEEEAKHQFGFFLNALKYGTPPHGGIALGVDRIAMILAGTDAIRDVIAFPKTQKATCLMSEAPSTVKDAQLRELSIDLRKKP